MAAKVLREHQLEAVAAILTAKKGKVILPTGTGKTIVEGEVILRTIVKQARKREAGIFVIFAPRIILTFQLLREIGHHLTFNGVEPIYLNVNSGEFNNEELTKLMFQMGLQPEKITSTTNATEIARKMTQAATLKRPLIIASTYHSAHQIDTAQSISSLDVEIFTYDESQYCVDRGEFAEVPKYSGHKKHFYTATPKDTNASDGVGMNNEELFGKVLYRKSPREMIEAGEMVGPAIHLVGVRGDYLGADHTQDFKNLVNAIADSFNAHREAIKSRAADPNQIGPKLLITCDGQLALQGIHRAPEFNAFRAANPQVKLYMLSSDFGIYINGTYHQDARNRHKEELLAELQSLSAADEAIVIHVDMLSEGIDVPGITGIMPFRNMGKSKFLQNLGRGTRLHSEDRKNLYAGTMDFRQPEKYIKPYCWIIIPVFVANATDFTQRYLEWIEQIRFEYQFDSSELVIISNSNAATKDPEIEDTAKVDRQVRTAQTQIVAFLHDLEDAEFIDTLAEKAFKAKKMQKKAMFTLLVRRAFKPTRAKAKV